ncbi:DUF3618 domain-containing protein [Tateyamaria omphalii]|uniref:DUF3618 domain-containing protein n=1 Tax=Tateyamaria omphalii TaxID=299262 RepID=A0A1P8MR21_9RHOB|nr:DUF3618 domain-containing protein [Tateyamaria omphalii]APX10520.1 hypothetical protein BWR18_01515 [Tateyamaria omphalii]
MPDGSLPDIEQRVARDRAELARSLDVLSSTLDPDRLKREASDFVDSYGSDLGRQAWTAARENPAAFALVGAGLALLLSGTGRRDEGDAVPAADPPVAVPPDAAMDGFDARVAAADAQMRKQEEAAHAPASASRLRAALHSGLDTLPPEAKVRILNAREAAISAQEAVERQTAKMAGQAYSMARRNPIGCAAAAFGVGALVAALLPSTRREDELLGAHRDAMMAEAQTVLQAEVARARDAVADAIAETDKGQRDAGLHVPS